MQTWPKGKWAFLTQFAYWTPAVQTLSNETLREWRLEKPEFALLLQYVASNFRNESRLNTCIFTF